MGNPLQDPAPPQELAKRGQVIDTKDNLSNFGGLTRIIEDDLAESSADEDAEDWRHAPVDIRLSFGWADAAARNPALEGSVSTSVVAVCQRCLRPFKLRLELALKLVLTSGEAQAVADGYETWEYDGETVRPRDIVEEALIMALPYAAMHTEAADCDGKENVAVTPDTVRPFSGLQSLMNQGNGKEQN